MSEKTGKSRSPSRLIVVTALLIVVMLVPIIPFAIFGEQSEAWFRINIIDSNAVGGANVVTAISVVFALMIDILLPVPSSAVLTFAGAKFGILIGAVIGWVGLSLAAALGFWLGYCFGLPMVRRLSSADDLFATTQWLNKYGAWFLAAFRGLPVLAEASVLLAGAGRMTMARFWLPVLLANLVISLIYVTLGVVAAKEDWFVMALLLSVFIPLLVLLLLLVIVRLRN